MKRGVIEATVDGVLQMSHLCNEVFLGNLEG